MVQLDMRNKGPAKQLLFWKDLIESSNSYNLQNKKINNKPVI